MDLREGIRIKRIINTIFVFVLCAFLLDKGVFAQTGNFSAYAVIPDNQVDKRQTYFDLRMEPGSKQTIQIVIDNSRSEDLAARIQINPATTGRNGQIIYSESSNKAENEQVAITDVASLRKETVTVPAGASLAVDVDIVMPPENLNGTLLGGIVITEDTEDAEDAEDAVAPAEGVSVFNKVTYIIGLKITENDDPVTPEFELISIVPGLINYKTAVITTLQNNAPLIVKDLDVKAQIFAAETDRVLHELSLKNTEMAPLSKGEYVIDWGNTPLSAGTYRMNMIASYQGQEWSWDETFAIAGEAHTINSEAVDLKRDYTWLYVLIGCVALAIVGYVAYWAGKRNIRKGE